MVAHTRDDHVDDHWPPGASTSRLGRRWSRPRRDPQIVRPDRTTKIQIALRYRTVDSASGVTRNTAKRLAEHLGVDETQAIHQALHDLAVRVLPQYEQNNGPLFRGASATDQEASAPGHQACGPVDPLESECTSSSGTPERRAGAEVHSLTARTETRPTFPGADRRSVQSR